MADKKLGVGFVGAGFVAQFHIRSWVGVRDADMQELVDEIRDTEAPDAVIVLSHNGMDVDLKMASVVRGIDAIFGGHTHDGMPAPSIVANRRSMAVASPVPLAN